MYVKINYSHDIHVQELGYIVRLLVYITQKGNWENLKGPTRRN